jgi:hypothetical protein
LLEAAQIVRTDPNLPWSAINQSDPSPYKVLSPAHWENIVFTSTLTVAKACGYTKRLLNRNYCVPLQTVAGVGFSIRTAAGLEVTNFILVSSDVSTCPPYSLPLNNGYFVFMWHVSSTLKFTIHDGLGNLIRSAVSITTICSTANMVPWHGHCLLANGNWAITWATTGGVLQGAIYDPTGLVILAPFTIDPSCQGYAHFCTSCANGDFLVGCFDSSHTRHSCYRVSNSGTVIFGPIHRSTATAPFAAPDAARQHSQDNRCIELAGPLPNPNFCWMLPDSDGYCKGHVHDYLGNLVRICDVGATYHDNHKQEPICWTPQGFCHTHCVGTSPSTYCSFFDWFGNPIGQNKDIDDGAHIFPVGSTPVVFHYSGWCGSGIVHSRYAFFGGCEHRLIHCDPLGNVIGIPFNPQEFGSDDICSPHPCVDWDGTCKITYFTSVKLLVAAVIVKVGRSSVIGVAQADATNGNPVTIVGQGFFKLPLTQVFGPGVAFDQRVAPVPGCRGVVGGSNAILFGWSGPVVGLPPPMPSAPSPQAPPLQAVLVTQTTSKAPVAPAAAAGS